MGEIKIDSVASLIEKCSKVFKGYGQTVCWFRGQSSASWGLIPSVHRAYDELGEHSLAANFILSAPTRHPKTPDLSDLPSWISLMQHYGLPTRLLDWTTSPLVALFFALDSKVDTEDAAVWGLVPSKLNSASCYALDQTFALSGPESRPLLEAALSKGNPVDTVLAVMGQDIDLRMSLQQGTFTLHGTDVALNAGTNTSQYLVKFIIPQAARENLKTELWFLGIRRSYLFPDLANLALDLVSDNRRVPRK